VGPNQTIIGDSNVSESLLIIKDLNALHVGLGVNNVYMSVENLVLHAINCDNVNPIF
jgi:hypothetical protein